MTVPKARVIKATKRLLPPMNTRKARHKVSFPQFLLSLSVTLTFIPIRARSAHWLHD